MARSKSKSRLQKDSVNAKKGQELRHEDSNRSSELARQPAHNSTVEVNVENRTTRNNARSNWESNSECAPAIGLMEPASKKTETLKPALNSAVNSTVNSAVKEIENTSPTAEDLEFLLNPQEIEAALERVDQWLSEESCETGTNDSCLAIQFEPAETPAEVCDSLSVVMPDYRLELVTEDGQVQNSVLEFCQPSQDCQSNQDCQLDQDCESNEDCQSNQLIVVESEEPVENVVSSSSENRDVDLICQRLEATASAIEDRLEKLWTGFESNLNSRLSTMLQVFDRLPQQLVEVQSDTKSNPREATHNSKSTSPVEASWETRKRQMLSEFGMTTDEIEQLVPDQRDAKSGNDKSRVAANVESVALEALHSSLETLDKIDSGVRSEEIDRLKEQLTAQLREAEVELSINRAKLCKEWATLEQRATELNQRESALKSKYNDAESSTKHGLLDRITRHLSRRS